MSDLLFIPFQDYVKSICELHVDVAHQDGVRTGFIRMNSDEDILSLPNNSSGMIVIVSNFTGRAIGESDTHRLRQVASLSFLKKTEIGTGDPAQEIQNAQAKALEVMFDFYSRMKHDYEQDDCGPLKYVRFESMSFLPLDIMIEEHYGWEMTIPFDAYAPGFNPVKWTDTTP